jgi:hypothetical protein
MTHRFSVMRRPAAIILLFTLLSPGVHAVPLLNYAYPTDENGTLVGRSWTTVNVSIAGPDLDSFRFDWNGTNYSFYDDSLVLALNLNNNSQIGENDSYVVDASKYGNNGTVYGGASWNASGRFGGAVQFDGVDDNISIPALSGMDFGDHFALSAWVNVSHDEVKNLSAGVWHVCALLADGRAYCWGYNGLGQLGNGNTSSSVYPVPVLGGYSFSSISLGRTFSCGLVSNGSAYCWGENPYGQLGNGNKSNIDRKSVV